MKYESTATGSTETQVMRNAVAEAKSFFECDEVTVEFGRMVVQKDLGGRIVMAAADFVAWRRS